MTLSHRFSDALVYAAEVHRQQKRKTSGAPYLSHLLRVAGMALEHGADEDEAIAALLHDAIEDQGGRERGEDIRRRFGDRVAEIVEGCTDSFEQPKRPWRQRKEEHLAGLRAASPSVRLVFACDKLDNARSLLSEYRVSGEPIWRHFKGGPEGTLWYYRGAAEILKQAGPSPLVEELDRTVSELERLLHSRSARGTH